VKGPEEGAFGWTNRRVESGGVEFSASGEELLFSDRGRFVPHSCGHGQVAAVDEDAGGRRRTRSCRRMEKWWRFAGRPIFIRWRSRAARRFGLTHDGSDYAAERRARLGVSGRVGVADGVLVVLPIQSRSPICNSIPAGSRSCRMKTSSACARSMSRSDIRRSGKITPTCIWAWFRRWAARRDGWRSAIRATRI